MIYLLLPVTSPDRIYFIGLFFMPAILCSTSPYLLSALAGCRQGLQKVLTSELQPMESAL